MPDILKLALGEVLELDPDGFGIHPGARPNLVRFFAKGIWRGWPLEEKAVRRLTTLVHLPSQFTTRTIQIVRAGNDAVSIDGVAVDAAAFTTAGTYSFANVVVTSGVHRVASAGPIGVSTYSIGSVASLGAPAAMSLRPVAP